jgi:hypothetical protein
MELRRYPTLGFQMSIAYRAYWNWIDSRLAQYGSTPVKGRWPAFGANLQYLLDKRYAQFFDDNVKDASDGWMTAADTNPVLGTINSSGAIAHFELQDRTGKTLCHGVAGTATKMPNFDYCWATGAVGEQFRVVARGNANELPQFVISRHPSGTSFAP